MRNARTVAVVVLFVSAASLAPVAGAASAPEPQMPTNALLYINPDSANVSVIDPAPGKGFVPGSVFYSFCWPPMGGETAEAGGTNEGTFTVSADGTLSGRCTRNGVLQGTENRSSTLTGRLDPSTREVTFSFTGTAKRRYPPRGIAPSGEATFTSTLETPTPVAIDGDRAAGRAPFTWGCTAPLADACFFRKITGTIEYAVIFPELAGAAGDTAASGADATGARAPAPPSEKENRLLLILGLLGVSAAVIAAAFLFFRNRARLAAAGGLPTGASASGLSGAVGADRSGGFEGTLEYGEGAGVAAPAASKAYEALVVSQGSTKNPDDPLVEMSDANVREGERAPDPDRRVDDLDDFEGEGR
jgi:hypothetical protein